MPRTKDTEFFLKKLRELGGSAGNKALRERLNWQEEKYFKVRQALIEEGLVEVGRGQGGSVYLLDLPVEPANESQTIPESERSHYPQVVTKLEKQLKRDFQDAVVEQTAHQGPRSGGKWSRPDILALTMQRFEYV